MATRTAFGAVAVYAGMSETDRFPIPATAGAIAGAGAWLLGYLVTYLVTIDEIGSNLLAQGLQLFTADAADWKLVGWLFYNAHNVAVRIPRGPFTPSNGNFVAADDGMLWILYLVPPVSLITAGTLVTWRRRTALRSAANAVVGGSTILVGYLLLSIVGVTAFSVGLGGETLRPDPITAVLLAGVVYPLLFGSIGGLLAWLVAD
ncbi:transporter [Natribaculum luteum]|uniref:Transporter n=1 Tax=Natribaculum luteum TaxID=1586232 RepID=A0ABD5NVD0_9EURY|nr:hypothetical protein [Natribaculum luteum]